MSFGQDGPAERGPLVDDLEREVEELRRRRNHRRPTGEAASHEHPCSGRLRPPRHHEQTVPASVLRRTDRPIDLSNGPARYGYEADHLRPRRLRAGGGVRSPLREQQDRCVPPGSEGQTQGLPGGLMGSVEHEDGIRSGDRRSGGPNEQPGAGQDEQGHDDSEPGQHPPTGEQTSLSHLVPIPSVLPGTRTDRGAQIPGELYRTDDAASEAVQCRP